MLERLAELRYVKKLLEEEIERLQEQVDVESLEKNTPVHFGNFAKSINNVWSFDNKIVKSVINPSIFSTIAKISKTNLSAVTSKEEWNEIEKQGGISVTTSRPFLKFIHVQYPPTKIAIKTDKKFRTIFNLQ